MVIINWNVGAYVACCTMCQLEAHLYNDLGCHNNGKDFPTHSPSQSILSIDLETTNLCIKIVMYVY